MATADDICTADMPYGNQSTWQRDMSMALDGANEAIYIDAVSALGLPVDGVNWLLGWVGLGSEQPFLGSQQIRSWMTSGYEGYYHVLGYDGSPVPVTDRDQAFHTGGKIAGEVGLAAMTMGGAYMAEQAAVQTGETARRLGQQAIQQYADDAARAGTAAAEAAPESLSMLQRWRVMGSTDDLAYRLSLIQESEGAEAAAQFLQRASRSGIDPSQIPLMRSLGLDQALISMADDIARTQITSGALTNWFSRAARTASYVWNQPARAAMEAGGSVLSTGWHAITNPIQTSRAIIGTTVRTTAWLVGGTAATGAADLMFLDGAGTELVADQLPDGSIAATGLYTAVDLVRPEDEAAPEGAAPDAAEEHRNNPLSRETAERLATTFEGARDTAGQAAEMLGLTGNEPPAPADPDAWNIPQWLRQIPGVGMLISFFESAVSFFQDYVMPLFEGAENSDLLVQGSGGRVAALTGQQDGPVNPEATAEVVSHAGGDAEIINLEEERRLRSGPAPIPGGDSPALRAG